MYNILNRSLESIASLRHFYDFQKKYIDAKAKQGMKKYRMGYLTDYYFSVLKNGSEEEKNRDTFINLQKAIDNYIDIKDINERGIIYEIKGDNISLFQNVSNSAKSYVRYAEMPIIHGNNTLIMLITRFEEFIADFIETIYLKFPQKYLDKQTISFSEIENVGVDGIRQKIVTREIDHIMRESYTVWFKLFEEHNIKVDYCKCEYDFLKEMYARRNIIVHNSGIVNDTYLKNIPNTSYKCGEEVYVSNEYLDQAFDSIKTIIFCILIEALRVEKEKQELVIDHLFAVAFDELSAGNYQICKKVFLSLYISPFVNESTKHMAQINYWISMIETEGLGSVSKDIEKFDVSALDKIFYIAKYVLLQDFEKVSGMIDDLYTKKEIPIYALEEWPLFMHYKLSPEYCAFKQKHAELSAVVMSEPKTENLMENNKATQNVRAELQESEND